MQPFYGLLLTVILLALPATVQAGPPLPDNMYTEAQKTGFAFYRLAHREPDFAKWATGQGEGDQAGILRDGFRQYDPRRDMIKVQAAILVSAAADGHGGHSLAVKLGPDEMTYFPMRVAGMDIALIPSNPNEFAGFPVDAATYKALDDVVHLADGGQHEADAEIMVRPRSVDAAKPMLIDKRQRWLMMVDVAQVTIWDPREKTTLWSAGAPWFQSGEKRQLMDLYKH